MSQEFEVWDAKKYFEENDKLPEMSLDQKKMFLVFAKTEVENAIYAYERYTFNHGGLRDEAKDLFKEITKAEKMRNAIQEELN